MDVNMVTSILPTPNFIAAAGKRKRVDDTPSTSSPAPSKWDNLPTAASEINRRVAEINDAAETFLNQQHRVLRRPCAEGVVNQATRCVEIHCPNHFGLLQYMGSREKDCVFLTYEEALFACDCAKLALFVNHPERGMLLLSLEDCWAVLADSTEADNRYAVYSWLWRSGYVPLHAQSCDKARILLKDADAEPTELSFDFACYSKDKSFKKTAPGAPLFFVKIIQSEQNVMKAQHLVNFKPVIIQHSLKNKSLDAKIPVVLANVVNGKVVLHASVDVR